MGEDWLGRALAAARRARTVGRSLDQSSRPADVRQVAQAINTELLIMENALQNARREAQEAVEGNRAGLVATDAPATSRAAARAVSVRSGSQRARVLLALLNADLTDHELCTVTSLPPSSLRPRRVELVDLQLVTPATGTRSHGGYAWTVWKLTALGRSVGLGLLGARPGQSVPIDPDKIVNAPGEQAGIDPTLF